MSERHGQPLRGLLAAGRSPLFQGKFGRMFRSLSPATFGASDSETEQNLTKLGQAMSAAFDPPKDGKDDEESGIPALYTYLGQFIDHDLTFDPASSLQQQNDPSALTDFRTPAFDLDNVYGRGPDDQPYLYDGNDRFLLGDPISGGGDPGARDLARNNAAPRRALIGDPRNDENALVSQLQGLFLRFHNRMMQENPTLSFTDTQRLVRFHHQYVVINDFLPRIIHSSVIQALKRDGHYDRRTLEFFHWKHDPFMPVEFSVAAYRLGHSMVRPGYRLNDAVMQPIFPVPSQGLPEGLTGFRAMNPAWGLDWGRFVDIDTRRYDGTPAENERRLQFAYRLDTSLVNPLSALPPSVASNPASLAARNLLRSWRLGLPSGQQVARAMGVHPLDDKDILIGKATGFTGDATSILDPALNLPAVFKGHCPLWTYILAEAIQCQEDVVLPVQEHVTIKTPRLGPVGGRIVAEVCLGLQFGDPHSMLSLQPHWQPASGPNYALRDFVNYALGH
jgi:hypothetical protein